MPPRLKPPRPIPPNERLKGHTHDLRSPDGKSSHDSQDPMLKLVSSKAPRAPQPKGRKTASPTTCSEDETTPKPSVQNLEPNKSRFLFFHGSLQLYLIFFFLPPLFSIELIFSFPFFFPFKIQ